MLATMFYSAMLLSTPLHPPDYSVFFVFMVGLDYCFSFGEMIAIAYFGRGLLCLLPCLTYFGNVLISLPSLFQFCKLFQRVPRHVDNNHAVE